MAVLLFCLRLGFSFNRGLQRIEALGDNFLHVLLQQACISLVQFILGNTVASYMGSWSINLWLSQGSTNAHYSNLDPIALHDINGLAMSPTAPKGLWLAVSSLPMAIVCIGKGSRR